MLGPGAACEIANRSANCWSVIQPETATTSRWISGMTAFAPPNASIESSRKCVARRPTFRISSALPPGERNAQRSKAQQHPRQRPADEPDRHERGKHDAPSPEAGAAD